MGNPELSPMRQLKAFEIDWSLLPVLDRVLLAVSGGADSMALLLALAHSDRHFVVAHVNHGLRGAESDGDADFVLAHCTRLNLP